MPLFQKGPKKAEAPASSGKSSLSVALGAQRAAKKGAYAHGGEVEADEHYASIADAILAKKRSAAAPADPFEETPSPEETFEEASELALDGDEEPAPTDMVSSIRAKMKAGR